MFLTAMLAMTLAATIPDAQAEPASSRAAATSGCELHVWPAERKQGIAFSLYNGLIKGRASKDQIDGSMDQLLSPATQTAALSDADLLAELQLPAGTQVVRHKELLDRKTLNKIKERRASSASPC